MNALPLLVAGPAGLPLLLTLVNLFTWQRGTVSGGDGARVSVLIPARNEERTIEACVRAALADRTNVEEVVVYNDQSTDATGDIVRALAAEDRRVRLVKGAPLPAGWVGKPHACHRLAAEARGDVLFFVDSDTVLAPDGVARALSLLRPKAGPRAAAVTAVPRQDVGSLFERMIVPLLILTYTSWFPLRLVAASRDPRFLAANGQLLAVERDAYDAVGGFESVRNELVDDMAFCRRLKERGHRLVFADGFHIARCRMYEGARQVWEGFSKNLYEGIGGTPLALAAVVLLHAACFLVPYVACAVGLLRGDAELTSWGGLGVAMNVALRTLLVLRFAQPPSAIVTHPASIVGLLGIAVNSLRWSSANRLRWRGRVYQARKERLAS
ncbi:MAG: glycosyltransferase [Deltaproteobacteria bacterium]|nr:glycosyltransferase [Deltaproteobacteria bacterium]